MATETKTIVVPGEADTDFHFPVLADLDEMVDAVLEQSTDKPAFDQLIAGGVTKEQALKILFIRLMTRKNALVEAIIQGTKEPALHVTVQVPAAA